jgi:hypothetical protein
MNGALRRTQFPHTDPRARPTAASAPPSASELNRVPAPSGAVAARATPAPVTLRNYRFNQYPTERPTLLLAALALLATAATMAIAIALPMWLESAARPLADPPRVSRISDVAALQRDALLASACWSKTCAARPDR